MLKGIRARLTYANVMVTILAVLVIGGAGAYAAQKVKLKNNSVSTKKIRNGAVTEPKIADSAVTSAKIAAGAVNASKVGGGVLRDMVLVTDRTPDSGQTVTATKQAFPTCPEGYVIVGGGGQIVDDDTVTEYAVTVDLPIVEAPPGERQWFIQADDVATGENDDWALFARGICVRA